MAQFKELFRCAGVDDVETPVGVAVPFGGANYVALENPEAYYGIRAEVPRQQNGVLIEEMDGSEIRRKLNALQNELSQPGVDPQRAVALMPHLLSQPRYFKIQTRGKIGFPGALVQAKAKGKTVAQLKVVVLDTMKIKVAIRNVQIRDERGKVSFHSSRPVDAPTELNNMNAVWIPQANMVFELVSSQPALIDMNDKATRDALIRGHSLKDPSILTFPPVISPEKVREVFYKLMVPGAHITFFAVDKLATGPNGTMHGSGMGFIAATHEQTTFAHEAGHFLGGEMADGKWRSQPHTYDRSILPEHVKKKLDVPSAEDYRHLMRADGAGWKITFPLLKKFRGFFDRHPVH